MCWGGGGCSQHVMTEVHYLCHSVLYTTLGYALQLSFVIYSYLQCMPQCCAIRATHWDYFQEAKADMLESGITSTVPRLSGPYQWLTGERDLRATLLHTSLIFDPTNIIHPTM